jgi:hypothetical protein
MYVGSYHRAARRAAEALARPGDYVMILSAKYGLLGQPGAIDAQTLTWQAQQLGLADVADVVVLAGRAYADLVRTVWPHAARPLAGTAGIGHQLHRLAAITATGTLPTTAESESAPASPGRRKRILAASCATAAAVTAGRRGGRPPVITDDQLDIARARQARGESVTAIAAHLGVGRSTLYRALQPDDATAAVTEQAN